MRFSHRLRKSIIFIYHHIWECLFLVTLSWHLSIDLKWLAGSILIGYIVYYYTLEKSFSLVDEKFLELFHFIGCHPFSLRVVTIFLFFYHFLSLYYTALATVPFALIMYAYDRIPPCLKTSQAKWVGLLVFLWVMRFVVAGGLFWVYQTLYNPENLQQLIVQEMRKVLREDLAANITPPEQINVSLFGGQIQVVDWKIPDSRGKTLFAVDSIEVNFQLGFTIPKLTNISIHGPKVYLHQDKDQRLNIDILRPSKDDGKKRRPIIQEKHISLPKVEVLNAGVYFSIENDPDLSSLLQVTKINFTATPEKDFEYKITSSFFHELTDKFSIEGYFHYKERGLYLVSSGFEVPLNQCTHFIKIDDKLQLSGSLKVQDIFIQGLSKRRPGVSFSGNLSIEDVYCNIDDYHLRIGPLDGSLMLADGAISRISTSATLNEGVLSVEGGRLGLENTSLYLPFRVSDFQLDEKLFKTLESTLSDEGRKAYAKELEYLRQFKGKLELSGVATYTKDQTIQFENIKVGLKKANFPFPDGAIEELDITVSGSCSFLQDQPTWDSQIDIKLAGNYRDIAIENFNLNLRSTSEFVEIISGSLQCNEGTITFHPALIELKKLPIIEEKIHISIKDLRISYDNLWKKLLVFKDVQEIWRMFEPEGIVDGDIYLQGNVKKSRPKAELRCRDFTAEYEDIPYRVEDITAKIFLENDCLELHIRGHEHVGKTPVKVFAKVWPFEPKEKMKTPFDVYVNVDKFPVNEQLYKAFGFPHEVFIDRGDGVDKVVSDWAEDIFAVWKELGVVAGKGHLTSQIHVHRKHGTFEGGIFHVNLKAKDLAVRYVDFPYPITGIEGEVVAKKNMVMFPNMKGNKDDGRLKFSGELQITEGKVSDVQLKVTGRDIAIDEDLLSAIDDSADGEYAELWEDLQPKGKFHINFNLGKKAEERRPNWRAKVKVIDGSAKYQPFPYGLEKLKGKMTITPGDVRIHEIAGNHDDAKVRVKGRVKNANVRMKILGEGVDYAEVRELLPEDIKESLAALKLQGKVGAEVSVTKRKDEKNPSIKGRIFLRKMSGYHEKFPYKLENLEGYADIGAGGCSKMEIRGESEGGEIFLEGSYLEGLSADIEGKNILLSKKLYNALPETQQEIWDMLAPDGRMNLKLRLADEQFDDFSLFIVPQGGSFSYSAFPFRLSDVQTASSQDGVLIDPKKIVISNILARHGKGRITVNGDMYSVNKKQQKWDMKIKVRDLPINPELHQGLKPYFPSIEKTMKPIGIVKNGQVNFTYHVKPSQKFYHYKLDLKGLEANMEKEKNFLDYLKGDFLFEGFAYDDQGHAQGHMKNVDLMFDKILVEDVSSDLRYFNNYLSIPDYRGKFYQGDLQGTLLLDTSDYSGYQGSLNFQGTQLKLLAEDLAEPDEDEKDQEEPEPASEGYEGIVGGGLNFQGSSHDIASMTGRGWIRIEDGKIFQLPILLAFLDLFSLPSKPAVREGKVGFSIAKEKMEINQLRLYATTMNVSGDGTLGFDGEVDLRLLTNITPRIPIVDQLWDSLKKDFFAVQITGNIKEETSITLTPWKAIWDLVR